MPATETVMFALSLFFFVVCLSTCVFIAAGIWRGTRSERKASALLTELLSEGELRQLRANGYIDVPSPGVQGRTYRIPARRDQVEVHESGRLKARLCVEPVGWLPDPDIVLMHKLMIEGNEQEYLARANAFHPVKAEIGGGVTAFRRIERIQ